MSETQSALERLTPEGWRYVGIYPSAVPGRCDLRGRCNSIPWYDHDLHVMGMKIEPTWGITHEKAKALGQAIEDWMNGRTEGVHKEKKEPKKFNLRKAKDKSLF